MAKINTQKSILVIAGPGAGKTHNMVEQIIENIPQLHPCRYMAVITYTNSATNNIKKRLAHKISIPPNLFIGTLHSFLNKFIVIPFSSFSGQHIGIEKLFMQFGIDDLFAQIEKEKPKSQKSSTLLQKAVAKKAIKDKMNQKGFITFDQTLSISKTAMEHIQICELVANRVQYLFVDEFQDSGNEIYSILEELRKKNKTKIYCVGDPEQYIQSFDSSIKLFKNIPILKASGSTSYEVQINNNNFRCSPKIVSFLNHFNKRTIGNSDFQQSAKSKSSLESESSLGEDVIFIQETNDVTPILSAFDLICEDMQIDIGNRCVVAKQNIVIDKITASLHNKFMNPKKEGMSSPFNTIEDTILYTLNLNRSQFCDKHSKTTHDLRKLSIEIFHAIRNGEIASENDFGNYLKDKHELIMNTKLIVKIENIKFDYGPINKSNVMTVANIHTIKGLEHEAVLAIARNEDELLRWIETDRSKRDEDKDDLCRLGYVAFSRAEKLLCIGCLTPVTASTRNALQTLDVRILGRIS